MYLKTEMCIHCEKYAEAYCGHVLKGTTKITAGSCLEHRKDTDELMDRNGYCGIWLPKFGLLSENQWPQKNNRVKL